MGSGEAEVDLKAQLGCLMIVPQPCSPLGEWQPPISIKSLRPHPQPERLKQD